MRNRYDQRVAFKREKANDMLISMENVTGGVPRDDFTKDTCHLAFFHFLSGKQHTKKWLLRKVVRLNA